MNRMEYQGSLVGQGGQSAVPLAKFNRTAFDYIIIALGYLLMPFGLVLALLRLMGSHYKNYRKATNINLLFHVFVGGFVEVSIIFISSWINGENSFGITMIILIMFAVMFLLPAFFFGRWAATARFRFTQLTNSYMELIVGEEIRYIGSLSELMSQSESDVRRDILFLKERGILDPYIVFNEGHMVEAAGTVPNLVHPGRTAGFGTERRENPFNQQEQISAQPHSPPQLPKSIRCSGCGAQNTVNPGQSKSCEYCGTILTYS